MTMDTCETTWRDVAREPVLITGPSIPAMSVQEIKNHLNIDTGAFDQMLAEYIDAATAMVERDANVALLTQTWALYLDQFPDWEIELRKPPVASITSVVYLDSTGASTTLSASDYRLDGKSRPARLTPAYALDWPLTYPVTNAVTITFVCGETSRDTVSDFAKQAIRMLVGHWYKHRESVISTGAQPVEVGLAYAALVDRLSWSGGL